MINCQDQEEVDYYWDKLSQGGDPKAQQCGWLKDKFGLSWQVVPDRLPELMTDPDPEKARRAMEAMLKMKKIDIAGAGAGRGRRGAPDGLEAVGRPGQHFPGRPVASGGGDTLGGRVSDCPRISNSAQRKQQARRRPEACRLRHSPRADRESVAPHLPPRQPRLRGQLLHHTRQRLHLRRIRPPPSPRAASPVASTPSRRSAPEAFSALASASRVAAISPAARPFDRSSWSRYARASAKLGGQTSFGCPWVFR